MVISTPKFEAVFNNGGKFFRLLQDNFHPPEYVDALIAEHYAAYGSVTYIVDDALIRYMKQSFKRLKEGPRRKQFPNYKIIGLSKSGFTPFSVPTSKVGTVAKFTERISEGSIVCGSTQMKRKMVISTLIDLQQKHKAKELLFFVAYSDEAMTSFAAVNNLPVALMAADLVGPMPDYFGRWQDWYYLRCSQQHLVDLAMVNSRTKELHIAEPYTAGIGDHSFFTPNPAVENWIAEHTSLDSQQVRHANVMPDSASAMEVFIDGAWVRRDDVDVNWGGCGRGREDSFGLCYTSSN